MRTLHVAAALTILALPLILTAQSDDTQAKPIAQIAWQKGPVAASIGDQAEIQVPPGFLFSGAAGARKFMELTENVPSGKELGVLLPKDGKWFVVFEFNGVGYIKDDEKKSLDADAMLSSIKEGTEHANEARRQKGWETLTVLGWIQLPHYDEITHNLEWSMRAQDSKGQMVANYNTRFLGRRGVMRVGVVSDVAELDEVLLGFRQVMGGFHYTQQNDYKAFVKGDKVAEYGLTALVVGGAAAAAAKTGLFKILWKFILLGWKLILAAIAGLGTLVKRLFGRREKDPEPAQQQT